MIGFEKRAHLEQNLDFLGCHTVRKSSQKASSCTLFGVCSCFCSLVTHVWSLRSVLSIIRDEQLFEHIPGIDNLREVGPFLKSYHKYLERGTKVPSSDLLKHSPDRVSAGFISTGKSICTHHPSGSTQLTTLSGSDLQESNPRITYSHCPS